MITKEQLAKRRNYLGSSDISALFVDANGASLNPFMNSLDVFASKVYELEAGKPSKAMERGNRYEEGLVNFAREELGKTIITDPEKMEFINRDILDKNGNPFILTHLDGIIENENEFVECKSTGLVDEFGEEYTDDVPMRVLLQVHTSFLCTGWKKAWIPVLLGRFGLQEKMYLVERNEEIINAIIARGTQFWNEFVLTKTPPPATEVGHIETFKRIVRVPEKFAEVDSSKIFQWELRRGVRLDAEKKEEEAFAELLAGLGDAEGVHLEDGRLFTYFKQRGADIIDRKKLQTEFPDVYKAVTRENSYRVARIKK